MKGEREDEALLDVREEWHKKSCDIISRRRAAPLSSDQQQALRVSCREGALAVQVFIRPGEFPFQLQRLIGIILRL